jgi:hypothetical protein
VSDVIQGQVDHVDPYAESASTFAGACSLEQGDPIGMA